MLVELRVENFAIIEKLNISFEDGLTVITGETGAGKSIIIDAITLLVGGRGSSEYVRHGAQKAEIEALFDITGSNACKAVLKDIGIDDGDDMVILRRQIYSNGKSVCRVNGKMVTLSHLREVGQYLIDIHGQNEHQELLHSENHIQLLDRFGGPKLESLKKEYSAYYHEAREIYSKIQQFSDNERHIAQRLDLLRYQMKEIEEAAIKEDEETFLMEEKRKLNNFERIHEAVATSYEALSGEQKGLDWLRIAVNELEHVQALESDLDEMTHAISNHFYTLEDQMYRLRDYLDQMEYEPGRIDQVEARLNEFNNLKRKYGRTLSDVLAYYEDIKREYDDLMDRDQTIEDLSGQLKTYMDKLRTHAEALSSIRKQAAQKLTKAINRELKDLYMEKARFDVVVKASNKAPEDLNTYSREGIDRVEFYIATNPGEPLKPLARIASGGEMSRIMLALKSHFKSFQGITSIIFDEVDTGVSGRVAQAMAEKIFQLSQASQIFCITHLPQVAAMADHHLFISKEVKGNRTKTTVTRLNEDDQASEIARMISGVEMTDLTKQHAYELLGLAKEVKA
ncbi:DNA repair protein RecN (Recombination protein N) [Pullulanibacillus pueri]|uniref:DNA repair protein RecN n=1 Tax=Pullulanibacillus pueri TaxID=1437324 RepID=A0A8J2ZUT4_9BACL|nr:DNA repair protein RecN [Pullulanibacillus pueri]MBM7681602.1 DNA repair protein RecN (Recombination protein N) [Pullulanibacillus pueri]GGH79498.1 DNA repair protein RecN [Pullulanibacillus pueri]